MKCDGISYKPNSENKIKKNACLAFTAIPRANYKLTGENCIGTVFQLEKNDIDYLKYIRSKIYNIFERFNINNESCKQVITEAFDASIELLDNRNENKSKILMAFAGNEPCGILIGNALKTDKFNNLHYSSRKNAAKHETELDWLATWNKNVKGVGKILVNEFFHTLKKDGFKSVYVRSEVPEKSCAVKFYEKMGFRTISEKQRLIQRKNDNGYKIGQFDSPDDYILPMKASKKNIEETIKNRSIELDRREIPFFSENDLCLKLERAKLE